MPRNPYNKDQLRAREQFNDSVADTFAKIHKDQSIFYVGATNGSSAYSGRRITAQKATIGQALSLCTASRGDTIIVSPFHTETTTAATSISTAGTKIKGLSIGNKRPVFTINGAVDLFSLDAAGCEISGIECAIVTTTAATSFINIAAANCKVSDIYMVPSATAVNVVDCITLTASANDAVVSNVKAFNTTVAVNSFVSLEGAATRVLIENCHFSGDAVTAGIIDAATVTFLVFRNNVVKTVGTNIPACVLDSNPTGEAYGNYMLGTDATIANNVKWGSALILANNYVRGGTGSTVSATNIIPALDT
jgi:hypothetical protein